MTAGPLARASVPRCQKPRICASPRLGLVRRHELTHSRSSDRPALPGALVAAGVRWVGDAGLGPDDDLRGGAVGAFGVQLAAVAVSVREARGQELGAVP